MLDRPLPDLTAWTQHFAHASLPVLRRTAEDLDALRQDEANANARDIAVVILRDPLMTAKVLALLGERRSARQLAEVATIDRAIVMMGVTPFFANFAQLTTLEQQLRGQPRGLLGALRAIQRARVASYLARDWAIRRSDTEVEEITVAALLDNFADILLWCHAPALALGMRQMQDTNPKLRTRDAQQAVLGIHLADLQLELAHKWHLPELLVTMMDERNAANPRVRNVALAVNLARHAANGWQDAALPDDYRDVANLIHLDAHLVPEVVREVVELASVDERQG